MKPNFTAEVTNAAEWSAKWTAAICDAVNNPNRASQRHGCWEGNALVRELQAKNLIASIVASDEKWHRQLCDRIWQDIQIFVRRGHRLISFNAAFRQSKRQLRRAEQQASRLAERLSGKASFLLTRTAELLRRTYQELDGCLHESVEELLSPFNKSSWPLDVMSDASPVPTIPPPELSRLIAALETYGSTNPIQKAAQLHTRLQLRMAILVQLEPSLDGMSLRTTARLISLFYISSGLAVCRNRVMSIPGQQKTVTSEAIYQKLRDAGLK